MKGEDVPRYHKTRSFDKSTPLKNWLRLVANLSRAQASLLFQLRSGHIGLNRHLHQIKPTDSPRCTNCSDGSDKMIQHFLFECTKYGQERHIMQRSLCRCASNLAYLLSNPDATLPLLKYIHTTRHLKQTFATVYSGMQ